jgi:hypothetical protein
MKISQLPSDSNPTTSDYVPALDTETNTTRKITLANILSLFFGNIPAGSIGNEDLNLSGTQTASVITNQATTSTSPADLATVGPSVTAVIGSSGTAWISIWCACSTNVAGAANAFVSVDVSGATTRAANNSKDSYGPASYGSGVGTAGGATFLMTGLNAGSTTFTLKYSTTSGTATFDGRKLTVMPI